MAEKLRRSEIKYGWSDGWKDADWQEECLADFNHHIDKGDPRDVAAYCAFMWFHGWQTQHTAPPAQDFRADDILMLMARLVRALKKHQPDSDLVLKAVEYLNKNGYSSPLRQQDIEEKS